MQSIQSESLSNASGLKIVTSIHFNDWLNEQYLSLAFTTYQAGKLFLIGLQPNGRLSVFERTFDRCMGLWVQQSTPRLEMAKKRKKPAYDKGITSAQDDTYKSTSPRMGARECPPRRPRPLSRSSLYLSSLYQIWGFENALEPGQTYDGYDCLYIPQASYVTGDLDIHDLVVERSRKLVFANTLFNCLGTVSNTHSFTPLWQPPFISQLIAEDRCHLNGIALQNGQVRFVTAVGQTDLANDWRSQRRDGGCVIDVKTNQVIATGLSMPHSPRWYQNRLWLLNSGTGEFGYVDRQKGAFEPVVFCPGYLRGCAFYENYAIVGLSRSRNKTFSGLLLDEKLKQTTTESFCGLLVIDLLAGKIVHWLKLEGIVSELYDVSVLLKIRRPMAIGLKSDEIKRLITVDKF